VPPTAAQQAQINAMKQTGFGPIHLLREGDWVIVRVEYLGKWVEVIRELHSNNFSHIIEPLGILEAIRGAGKK
jgi:hypothetical protein